MAQSFLDLSFAVARRFCTVHHGHFPPFFWSLCSDDSSIYETGSRLLTGIGEASYLAFVGTIIDIIAPNASRSLWLGTFYMR